MRYFIRRISGQTEKHLSSFEVNQWIATVIFKFLIQSQSFLRLLAMKLSLQVPFRCFTTGAYFWSNGNNHRLVLDISHFEISHTDFFQFWFFIWILQHFMKWSGVYFSYICWYLLQLDCGPWKSLKSYSFIQSTTLGLTNPQIEIWKKSAMFWSNPLLRKTTDLQIEFRIQDNWSEDFPENNWFCITYLKDNAHMMSPLRGTGGKAKMRCYWMQGMGCSKCSGRPIFIFV